MQFRVTFRGGPSCGMNGIMHLAKDKGLEDSHVILIDPVTQRQHRYEYFAYSDASKCLIMTHTKITVKGAKE